MIAKTLHYADIVLMPENTIDFLEFVSGDTGIQYDYFDSVNSYENHNLIKSYSISNPRETVGYIALYNFDSLNCTANIFGKIRCKQNYGDIIKAFLALLRYAFSELKLKKINLIYRHDNYFYDDVCLHLGFIREGVQRGQLNCDGKFVDLKIYGMLDYEFLRLASSKYKRMFAWDYSFDPRHVMPLSLAKHFNCRVSTNSIDNPNRAYFNDWLYEFVMNKEVDNNNLLKYKDVTFPVSIFDQASKFDCFSCTGQVIEVPQGCYNELLLVTTALFGYKQTVVTAIYDDDSREESEFSVGDWCDRIVRNEYIIHIGAACRELGSRSNMIKCDAYIYLQRVQLNPNKNLRKLIFPKNHDIFIFAGSLC